MADLDALIRLRRHRVEDRQKALAELYRQAEALENSKRDLAENLEKERCALDSADANNLETRAYYGRYAEAVRINIARLDEELRQLDTRIAVAQDVMREAFADLKRVEIVHRRRQEESAAKAKTRESQELDEIGLESFRRKEEE